MHLGAPIIAEENGAVPVTNNIRRVERNVAMTEVLEVAGLDEIPPGSGASFTVAD